ncbi:MAG TPA: cytochrome c biogenesis protein CcdA [Vicinamibacterales bacterium]
MSDDVSLLAAFIAGILSFISPCVLPLVPGYLSFVSGVSLDQFRTPGPNPELAGATRRVFTASLAFVVGFSIVFVILGAAASSLGKLVYSQYGVLSKVAGTLVILFGLHTMGVLRIPWLYREARVETRKPAGLLGALLVGFAFAFAWTPCIGPILGAILALASQEETVSTGMLLLAVYSAGLGIPFLATSLAVNRFFEAFKRIRKHYKTIEVGAGLLMVTIGVLILTNQFTLITRVLTPYLPTF